MTSVRVLLLGPFEVQLNGKPISIQHPITRALLIYLASRGGMTSQDELLPLFLPAQPGPSASRRLNENLDLLRETIPELALLRTDVGLVGLDFDQVYVDQLEFQNLIDQAGRSPWQISTDHPLSEDTYQLLRKAVGLWRGPHFLAGIDLPDAPGFVRWLTSVSQHLGHLRGHVLERLADHAYTVGDPEQALQWVRLALLGDELNEDLHYRLLLVLIHMERQSEALEHFTKLQKLLRDRLDTNPSPRLVDLYRQIRDKEHSPQIIETRPKWSLRSSIHAPFVGRASELEQLQNALENGGGVLVYGESGQGKTRLLQEFVAQIEKPQRLLLTACRPAEINLPFQPVIDLLRNYVQPDEWLELEPTWASQITLLIPELGTMRPDLERPVIEFAPDTALVQARSLLLEAIRQVMVLTSRGRSLLFLLDDAQWADEATLAVVAYLLERPPFEDNALLIVAARSEEKNPHLEAILNPLRQSSRFREIHLHRFSPDEISTLAGYVLGYTFESTFILQLANETGGNAFYVLETLRSIRQQALQPDGNYPAQIPLADSIQTLIQSRLAQLNSREHKFLEIAAIIGVEFASDIVASVGAYRNEEVIQILEELENRLLIERVSESTEDIRHRFIHHRIQEFLLQEINPIRARLYHRMVADALENKLQGKTSNQAAILAQHFEKAGEANRAFDYWLQASRRARQLFSTPDALHAFHRAEQLIARADYLSDQQLYDLYAEWTAMAYRIEDSTTLQRLNNDLLRLGRERNSPLLIGTALAGLSDACLISNQLEKGLLYTEQAIPYLEKCDNIFEYMEIYNRRGVFLYMLNRVEDSIESFQDALSVGTGEQGTKVLRARSNAHYQIAIARTLSGWPESGLNHALLALADSGTRNRAHEQVSAYSALALSRYLIGYLAQAQADAQMGIELGERIQAWRMLGYLHGYQSMTQLAMGNIDAALDHAELAIELGERYGHHEIAAGGYRMIGDLYFWLRAPMKAVEYFRRAVEASQFEFLAVDPIFRLGLTLCQVGEVDEGADHIEQAITLAQDTGQTLLLIMAKSAMGMALTIADRWDQASRVAVEVQKEATQRKMTFARLVTTATLGEIALHADDTPKALQHFRTVALEAAATPYPWLAIHTQTRLAKTLRRIDKPMDAISPSVHELLDQLEATANRVSTKMVFRDYRQQVIAANA